MLLKLLILLPVALAHLDNPHYDGTHHHPTHTTNAERFAQGLPPKPPATFLRKAFEDGRIKDVPDGMFEKRTLPSNVRRSTVAKSKRSALPRRSFADCPSIAGTAGTIEIFRTEDDSFVGTLGASSYTLADPGQGVQPLVVALPTQDTNSGELITLKALNNPDGGSESQGFNHVGAVLFGDMALGSSGRAILVQSRPDGHTIRGLGESKIFSLSCDAYVGAMRLNVAWPGMEHTPLTIFYGALTKYLGITADLHTLREAAGKEPLDEVFFVFRAIV
ncbi:hypothetical protein MNV49_002473 [Pseudohyphozyma bogoriensis]|nr:hypothetical protein MNV49_002473 [Pseudohyphozyma bogoriensis]